MHHPSDLTSSSSIFSNPSAPPVSLDFYFETFHFGQPSPTNSNSDLFYSTQFFSVVIEKSIMQDPSTYFNQFPEHEILKCPRCDSSNTKFCYYNNYNLSQPRHYCKNCKRYWTKGGTLRNIPVGGASRKITKRSSSKRPTTPPNTQQQQTSYLSQMRVDPKVEERFPGLESGDMKSWSGSTSDWPDDLAIYNPPRGSDFQ